MRAGGGVVQFQRPALNVTSIGDESEAFYLRVYGVGEYCYHGADLGILMTRSTAWANTATMTPIWAS